MNVLQRISLHQLRSNKGRVLATVAGIALATAMVASVLFGSDAAMDALRRYGIALEGNWHFSKSDLSAETAHQLYKDPYTAQWGVLGGKWQGTYSEKDPLLAFGVSGHFFHQMQAHYLAGRGPAAPGELLLEENFAAQQGLTAGDHLEITDESGQVHSFTVCGILGASVLKIQNLSPGSDLPKAYYAIDWNNPLGENNYRWFSTAKELSPAYFDHIEELQNTLPSVIPGSQNLYNMELITWSGSPGPERRNPVLLVITFLRIFLIAVIAIAAGQMILNSFEISLNEHRRTLGLLASVGATQRQLQSCMRTEAFFMAMAGIPLGLAGACGALALAFRMIRPIFHQLGMGSGVDISLHLMVRPIWLLVSAAVVLLVVLWAANHPLRRLRKQSLIERLRNPDQVQVPSQAGLMEHFATRMGFSLAVLGIKNAKRDKRRFHATTASLAICIALWIAAAGLSRFIPQAYFSRFDRAAKYPVTVSYTCDQINLTESDLYPQLLSPQAPVDEIHIDEKFFSYGSLPAEQLTPQMQQLLHQPDGSKPYDVEIAISIIPDEIFLQQVGNAPHKTGTINCILINGVFDRNEFITQTSCRAGDVLETTWEGEPLPLHIAKVDLRGKLWQSDEWMSPTFLKALICRSDAEKLFQKMQAATGKPVLRLQSLHYQTNQPDALLQELSKLSFDDGTLMHNALAVSDNRLEILLEHITQVLLQLILYGFSGLLALVCGCHLYTTIATGLSTQRREFAMLCSVGTTEAQLHRMIQIQGLVYSVQGLFWGIMGGLALTGVEYLALRQIAGFFFSVPWWAIGTAVIFALVLSLLPVKQEIHALQKQTLIETIGTVK